MGPDVNWINEIRAILPEVLLTGYAFLLVICAALFPREWRRWVGYLALLCTGITLLLIVKTWTVLPPQGVHAFGGMFSLDHFSLFFKAIFLVGAMLAILLSLRFPDLEEERTGEYYALILFATVGMMFMASARDLIMIFVSLETMSLSSYLLVGYLQKDERSNEAALKYFVLGAFSSGIFAYGMSMVYGATGSTDLAAISSAAVSGAGDAVLFLGLVLMIVSLGFKVAAAPFHMWVPDAYQGAPTPITAFISTAAKAAAFAIFARIFVQAFQPLEEKWSLLLAVVSLISMTVGNVGAILQDNMKRMLAYSSIAHAGYALMAILAMGRGDDVGAFGLTALVMYMVVYTFMNMGAFGFVVMLRRENIVGDRVADFSGMARRAPVAAAAMLVLMLSLAGIPATAGFIGKWYLFGAAIRADFTWLAVAAVINSTISLYYYIRVVVFMYMGEPGTDEGYAASPFVLAALVVSLLFTLGIGLYPEPLINLARAAVMH